MNKYSKLLITGALITVLLAFSVSNGFAFSPNGQVTHGAAKQVGPDKFQGANGTMDTGWIMMPFRNASGSRIFKAYLEVVNVSYNGKLVSNYSVQWFYFQPNAGYLEPETSNETGIAVEIDSTAYVGNITAIVYRLIVTTSTSYPILVHLRKTISGSILIAIPLTAKKMHGRNSC